MPLQGFGRGTATLDAPVALTTGSSLIGSVGDPLLHYATAAGGFMAWNATTDLLTLPNNTDENLVAVFENPLGSNRRVHVDHVVKSTDIVGIARRRRAPTISSRTTAATSVNRAGQNVTAVAKLYDRANITLSGQGTLGRVDFVPANETSVNRPHGTIILQPGEALAWTYARASAGQGTPRAALQVVWWEVAV